MYAVRPKQRAVARLRKVGTLPDSSEVKMEEFEFKFKPWYKEPKAWAAITLDVIRNTYHVLLLSAAIKYLFF